MFNKNLGGMRPSNSLRAAQTARPDSRPPAPIKPGMIIMKDKAKKPKKAQYRPIIKWDSYYKRWNVSSETYATHTYAVKVELVDQSLRCNCPHGRSNLRSKKEPCKHIKAVENWLEKLPAAEREEYLLAR